MMPMIMCYMVIDFLLISTIIQPIVFMTACQYYHAMCDMSKIGLFILFLHILMKIESKIQRGVNLV